LASHTKVQVAFSRSSIAAALALVASSVAQAQDVIRTYAGGVPQATPVAGVAASIGFLMSVATDAAGNVYFVSSDDCVFKLDTNGVLTLVAGNSHGGYSGDGGPATSAQLNTPRGVAVDDAGDVYIADLGNNRIRKVSPAGIITTVVGNGFQGPSGDGGPATSAALVGPWGVAVDGAGNLYIAEGGDVREVSPAGIITTVAGNGLPGFSGDGGAATSAQLNRPSGVAVDGAGNLYIADAINDDVRKVSPAGTITTIPGDGMLGFSGDGGPATNAQLSSPQGVAVDGAGNVYIADLGNDRIRKVSPAGIISTVAGNGVLGYSGDGGPAIAAQLWSPEGVAVDGASSLYIADFGSNRVREVSPAGIITTVAGNGTYSYSGDGGPATSAQLYSPGGVAVDGAGNLYIADTSNNRIRRVSPAGIITTVAGNGTTGFSGDGGPATSAQLNEPAGLAVDGAGNLYIADTDNFRIRKVSTAGIITTIAGNGKPGYTGDGGPAASTGLSYPAGVALDGAGNLYIADTGNERTRKVSPEGIISTVAGNGVFGYSGDGGPATNAQLYWPEGVAVDGGGSLYIADSRNSRVRKVSPEGIISTVVGGGDRGLGDGGPATVAQLGLPWDVVLDDAGNLYIADAGDDRIRRVSPAGIITTIAGNGTPGYSGDGGLATSAQLNGPMGVAVDGVARILIADSGNNAIRLVMPRWLAPTRRSPDIP
jgi:trimeric autotransporter adhesin